MCCDFVPKYAKISFIDKSQYSPEGCGEIAVSYTHLIHSEAYAAGELKHGTIALIEDGTLVIGVLTQPKLYEKTISNMVECKSRGAYLMGLTTFGNYNTEAVSYTHLKRNRNQGCLL